MRKNLRAEDGNVIFMVLIAIALLAALAFSVTRSGRTSASMSQEDAIMAANQIMDYADSIDNAVQLTMVNGTTPELISFQNDIIAGYTNGSAADINKIFKTVGGGAAYQAPDTDWLDSAQSAQGFYGQWYFPANTCVPYIGRGATDCNSDGDDNEEVVMILPYIKLDICLALNKKLDIDNCAADDPCDDNGEMWPGGNTKFTGAFADSQSIYPAAGSELLHKTAGCLEGSGTVNQPAGTYHFFKVLVAR